MFTDEQVKKLAAKLDPANVSDRTKGGTKLSYVEGWWVIHEANRIFGFDGWTRETVELTENTVPTKNDKGNHVVSFRAKVRVTAGGVSREGTGFGSGIARDIHDAYESAVKEAETDAMKRALMTFGNPFGLALYDKEKTDVGVEKLEQPKGIGSAPGNMRSGQKDFDKVVLPKMLADISSAQTEGDLKAIFTTCFKYAKANGATQDQIDWLTQQKDARKAALTGEHIPVDRVLDQQLDEMMARA
jgi:DNA recombination protein Rad52